MRAEEIINKIITPEMIKQIPQTKTFGFCCSPFASLTSIKEKESEEIDIIWS